MPLRISERNEVFQLLRERDFDPRRFKWNEEGSRLTHVRTGHWFDFEYEGTQPPQSLLSYLLRREIPFRGRAYFPASWGGIELIHGGSWVDAMERVADWLEVVRQDDIPDLWAAIDQESDFLDAESDHENTPFTPEEKAHIVTTIGELKVFLVETHGSTMTSDQLAAIQSRLDYLAGAVSRMGRLDWRNLMAGALIGLAVQGLAPEAPVRDVLRLLIAGVSHFFGPDLGLPPGGGGYKPM